MTTLRNSWNAPEWRDAWMKAAATRDGDALHTLRKEVFAHTVACVQQGGYTAEGQWVPLPPVDASAGRFYDREFRTQPQRRAAETAVRVVAEDCLLTARRLAELGEEVCVLNMANRRTPGGGVLQGCGAQEEYLFRCSNYYTALYRYGWQAQEFGLAPAAEQYPMDRDFGGVFTRGVTIFRGVESEGYPLLPRPWQCNMVAVAALNRPETEPTENGERLVPELVPAAKNKIRTVLRVAADNGQYNLVLGAMGCGAFRNPPAHVAELFAEVLAEAEFRGVFKRVFFSIIEDHNSRGSGNWEPFARVFNPTTEVSVPAALHPLDVLVCAVPAAEMRGVSATLSLARRFNLPYRQCYAISVRSGKTTARKVKKFIRYAARNPHLNFLLTCPEGGADAELAPLFADAARLPNVKFPLEYQRHYGSDAYLKLIAPPLSAWEVSEVHIMADLAKKVLQEEKPTTVFLFTESLREAVHPFLEEGEGSVSRAMLFRLIVLLENTPAEQWSGLIKLLSTDTNSVALPYVGRAISEISSFLDGLETVETLHLSHPHGTPVKGGPSALTPAAVARLLHSHGGYHPVYDGHGDFCGFMFPLDDLSLPIFHLETRAEVTYPHAYIKKQHMEMISDAYDPYWSIYYY